MGNFSNPKTSSRAPALVHEVQTTLLDLFEQPKLTQTITTLSEGLYRGLIDENSLPELIRKKHSKNPQTLGGKYREEIVFLYVKAMIVAEFKIKRFTVESLAEK